MVFELVDRKAESSEYDTPLSHHKIVKEKVQTSANEKISSLYGTSCRVQPGAAELPILEIGRFSTGCEYKKFEPASAESKNFVQARASSAHFYSKDGEWTSRFPIGTGFAVAKTSEQCLVLTDNHVVSGADQLQVKLSDGEFHKAEVQVVDKSKDLALVAVSTGEGTASICKPVTLAQDDFAKGSDNLYVIGFPARSESLYLSPAEHKGNISRSEFRDADGDELGLLPGEDPQRPIIDMNAHVEGGNSGSPVFNEKGEVGAILDAGDSSKYRAAFATAIDQKLIDEMIKSATQN